MRIGALLLLPLMLTACDDRAAVRQNLAQCKLDSEARGHTYINGYGYVSTCMQARGFALDESLDKFCHDDLYPQYYEVCYRADNALSL